jgi:hypothetical protein
LVVQWWASEARGHREQWDHPLSTWENEYLQAMASSSVPAELRMRPPLKPGTSFEDRQRIVAHYAATHPATIRLLLGLYQLGRDSNPLHFALERGWQVGRGKEMFTEQDVSRLGAAAEFFAVLAVGVAVEKAMGLAHPMARGGGTAANMPNLPTEVERAFVEAVRLRTIHMVKALSNQERGPVLTGVLDTRTGRTFFGVNHEKPPPDLHPILKRRLDDYLLKTGSRTPKRAGPPGAHSEIIALNRALHAREALVGRPIEPKELSEFVLHNRSMLRAKKIEGVPPPCANCEAILPLEIRILP